jgi:PAS domain S-box-containing protein
MNVLLVKDEGQRSQVPEQYDAPNSAADPILDDLARLAAQICEAPVAMVCLVGTEFLEIKAAHGILATNLPLESTPCGMAILGETIYEIPDMSQEPEFDPQGMFLEGQTYCFYAAAPLTTSAGTNIGTLAVMDSDPRRLTQAQAEALATLSRQVVARIDVTERIRQMEDISRSQVNTELTLRESEARYRQLVEGSLGIVFTHDLKGQVLSLNAHGAAVFGRGVEDVIGLPLEEFVPARRRTAVHEYLETLAAAGEAQGLLHLAHTDGDVRVIAYRNRLMKASEREPYVGFWSRYHRTGTCREKITHVNASVEFNPGVRGRWYLLHRPGGQSHGGEYRRRPDARLLAGGDAGKSGASSDSPHAPRRHSLSGWRVSHPKKSFELRNDACS